MEAYIFYQNELLLDRLVVICEALIVKRMNISNVGAILSDATHFHALPLVRSSQGYMACIMETLLEGHYLDDLSIDLIRQLSAFVHEQQRSKYPVSRSNMIVDKAIKASSAWLALQDIPEPFIPTFKPSSFKDSPKLSPPTSAKRLRRQSSSMMSPPSSPLIRPQFTPRANLSGPPDDEVFLMDDPEPSVPPTVPHEASPETPTKTAGWKPISSAPRYVLPSVAMYKYLIYTCADWT